MEWMLMFGFWSTMKAICSIFLSVIECVSFWFVQKGMRGAEGWWKTLRHRQYMVQVWFGRVISPGEVIA